MTCGPGFDSRHLHQFMSPAIFVGGQKQPGQSGLFLFLLSDCVQWAIKNQGAIVNRQWYNYSKIYDLCCWGLLLLIIVSWIVISVAGDLWWPVTLFLFSPRWILALPIAILIPYALWEKRLLLLPLVAALLIVVGPIMGFTFPVTKRQVPGSKSLRIITCNLQNGEFDSYAFNSLIRDTQPEIVALQEFPSNLEIKSLEGWHHLFEGDLHIFSRYPIVGGDFRKAFVPMHKWPRACFLYCTVKTPHGDLTFCTVHLPSPRYGLQNILDRTFGISLKRKKLLVDETEYRRQKSQEISAIVDTLSAPKVIAGDFNMPVESALYRKYWGGYNNSFSRCGTGYGWTERASVRGIPVAVRIDHVLTGNGVLPLVCETGSDVGSDHLPVIADISLNSP